MKNDFIDLHWCPYPSSRDGKLGVVRTFSSLVCSNHRLKDPRVVDLVLPKSLFGYFNEYLTNKYSNEQIDKT